jgi:hypothetical protein
MTVRRICLWLELDDLVERQPEVDATPTSRPSTKVNSASAYQHFTRIHILHPDYLFGVRAVLLLFSHVKLKASHKPVTHGTQEGPT